jgi:BirA family biotin operon repressor/biotin-[acetyl-CoA-carboxylase] ligase
LAGILSEVTFEAQQIKFIILGIGINVNQSGADFPEIIRDRAISLAQAIGTPIDPHDFLEQVLFDLDHYYRILKHTGFARIRSLWKANCPDLGRPIELRQAQHILKGVFQDLAPDGSLVLQQPDGVITRITSGELH